MKYLLFLLSLFPILTSCERSEKCLEIGLPDGNITNQEEYAVINALIDSIYGAEKFIHILQESTRKFEGDLDIYTSETLDMDATISASYINLNLSPMLWNNFFGNNKGVISDAEIACYYEEGNGWSSYKIHYPDSEGRIETGRPLIVEDLAYISWRYYTRQRVDSALLGARLKKVEGEWRVDKHLQLLTP